MTYFPRKSERRTSLKSFPNTAVVLKSGAGLPTRTLILILSFYKCLNLLFCFGNKFLKFAAFVQIHDDIASADKFSADINLWDRRPIRISLDRVTNSFVFKHINRR